MSTYALLSSSYTPQKSSVKGYKNHISLVFKLLLLTETFENRKLLSCCKCVSFWTTVVERFFGQRKGYRLALHNLQIIWYQRNKKSMLLEVCQGWSIFFTLDCPYYVRISGIGRFLSHEMILQCTGKLHFIFYDIELHLVFQIY